MELSITMGLKPRALSEASDQAELIARARRKDEAAFAFIVDSYQNRLFGFVRRMVQDPDDAADIAQETFVRAFQGIGRFDGRSSMRTWLFRIAYNLCVDRARRSERTPSTLRLDAGFEEEESIDVPDGRWDPQGVVLDSELRAMLEAAIGSMSEKLRSVILLHDREDLAYEDIAKILQIPVGTVKSRLFLARAHLQERLGPYLRGEVLS
jgi:RNA polymerase sigma-70 factor (ECF subfamily)